MPTHVPRTRLLPPLLITLLLGACTPEPRVREATLDNLVTGSSHFIGRKVSTEGVVRSFPQPRHYWLEDDNLNRVGLVPEESVMEWVGVRVRATGTFRFEQGQGRLLDVEHLEVLAAP